MLCKNVIRSCRMENRLLTLQSLPMNKKSSDRRKISNLLCKKAENSTCFALFLASSSRRPRSTDRCTSFSQRPCTLSSRFLIKTTSCFWLKYFKCVPVLSSSMMWSRWEFTSVTNICVKTAELKVFRLMTMRGREGLSL